ncbi:DUF1772 domain-containing protein [Kibdelosporangium philippinense]|uniref:DUF1772 domain-containing protein n=1 Tax=Kibdelosporangium philippinense TaxID=211113 RepID=A0ABS8Z4Y1_9PSEU|nr:DUF1772 domain-containing protein [Kibdelosporangium philippinense]MCE7002537.1 DUF1772 domain-containing protein [Kibdelosporangium philippinense]
MENISRKVARLGQVHWLFGNVYEAAVDVPRLLTDARSNRPPKLLGAGSPLRYYLPAPATLAATAITLVNSWRSGGDKRVIVAAAASTASATALTAYLVRTVVLQLLHSNEPLSATETRALLRTWHRGNLVRLLALAIAMWALRQDSRRSSVPISTDEVDRCGRDR